MEEQKELELYEMELDEFTEGVYAISIVSDPAIQEDFLALSDAKVLLKVEDAEKRIVTGAILIPRLPIVRMNKETGEPYHIFFSNDTVRELSQRYLKNAYQSNVTLEHQVEAQDITLIESWIKDDPKLDKSVALGLDGPVGTWFGTMKVDNDVVWEEFIKAGHLKGFSIEAKLKNKKVTEMSNDKKEESVIGKIKTLLGVDQTVVEETKIETVSLEQYTTLCTQVNELSAKLDEALKTIELSNVVEETVAEVIEETVVEAKAEVIEETIVEEKIEEVEMIAQTEVVEEVVLAKPAFDYKLTTAQRLINALKS